MIARQSKQRGFQFPKRCVSTFIFLLLGVTVVSAAPVAPGTSHNTALSFPSYRLLTNGVPGLTNPPPRLMVNSVSTNSTHGGKVSLLCTQTWSRRLMYGADVADVVFDDAGNVVVSGSGYGATSLLDIVTVKYSTNGTPLWTNRYDNPFHNYDICRHVGIDRNNNVYVSGDSDPYFNPPGIVLLKYSKTGVPLWTNRFKLGTNHLALVSMAVDPNGNSYVVPHDLSAANPSFLCIKFNSSGTPVWTNRYKFNSGTFGASQDYAGAVRLDQAGNVYVSGSSFGNYNDCYVTIKYALNGMAIWTNRVTNVGANFKDISVDRVGNIFTIGHLILPTESYRLTKYLNNGQTVWSNALAATGTYDGGGVPRIITDLWGNVFVTKGTPGAQGQNADFTTTKLNAAGATLWSQRFFETNFNNGAPAGTATDSAGNFYLAGHAGSQGKANYYLVKYNSAGIRQWTQHYGSTIDDAAEALAVANNGNIVVSGSSGGDFLTVLCSNYILYKPPTNFVGTDSFSFTVFDNLGKSVTNSVTISVK